MVRRTDVGTVAMHWLLAATLSACVATGLRIEADGPNSVTPAGVAGVLPTDGVWAMHIAGGIVVLALAAAYPYYVRGAGLGRRLTLDRARALALLTLGPGAWGAVNVLLYWVLFAALAAQLATGTMVFHGFSGVARSTHTALTWVILAYTALHVAAHAAHGGARQLARVARPSRVPGKNPWRLALATAALGAAAAWMYVGADRLTRQVLTVHRVDYFTEEALGATRPITVATAGGANLDGGSVDVEVRAVHDRDRIYFSLSWSDPTRSLRQSPLIKTATGWRVLSSATQLGEQAREFAEDRVSLMLSAQQRPYGPGAFHPGQRPLSGMPASSSGRGLHYTTDGTHMEAWVWHASVDACDAVKIGAPAIPSQEQRAGGAPYRGGVRPVGPPAYVQNFVGLGGSAVRPIRLPKDAAAVQRSVGSFDRDPDHGDAEDSRWWMASDETSAYTEAADGALPVGTIIPSAVAPSVAPREPMCHGSWRAGRWTVVASRRMAAADSDRIDVRSGVNAFVAVFDHTAAGHTRHTRPIVLEVE